MKTLLSAFVLLSSTAALAWGTNRSPCSREIAEKYLEVKTLSKVREILKGESLARVSTWHDGKLSLSLINILILSIGTILIGKMGMSTIMKREFWKVD